MPARHGGFDRRPGYHPLSMRDDVLGAAEGLAHAGKERREKEARLIRNAFVAALVFFLMAAALGMATREAAEASVLPVSPAPPSSLPGTPHPDGDDVVVVTRAAVPVSLPVAARNQSMKSPRPSPGPAFAEVYEFNRVELTTDGLELSNSLPSLCPLWSAEFTSLYQERCAYWLGKFATWQKTLKHGSGPAVYLCEDETKCHGLGDRMAGVLGALSVALHEQRPIRLAWNGLSRFFSSCMLSGNGANWGNPVKLPEANHGCYFRQASTCAIFGASCDNSVPRFYQNLDRACLAPRTCKQLREHLPQTLNAADVFGCPLRGLLEPTSDFLSSKIPFRINGKVTTIPVAEAIKEMEKYHVISIHFRMGDSSFFQHGKLSSAQANLLRPFRCAQTVQSFLEGRPVEADLLNASSTEGLLDNGWQNLDDEFKVNGKPVRWFFASDSAAMRALAARLYNSKLIMLDTNPKHIAYSHAQGLLQHTFAEWYLLGLGQEIVANRISPRSIRGDYYTGRVSSFWKTSWTYQLKHTFLDAEHCERQTLRLDGTWHNALECQQSPLPAQSLPQPHLEYQKRLKNSSFPRAWVVRGRIHFLDGQQ